ncbi:MAG: hypothetical protein AAGC55_20455, partial [Myxococcota bacterium]
LVITLDPSVASWCRKPIVLGPSGSASRPVVLGPHQLPRIDDEETARQLPELAVLTAAAHSENADGAEAVATALTVCEELDRERATIYADLLLSRLSKAAAHALEAVMETRKYSYQSEFARKYFGQGLAKGREEGLAEGREEGLRAMLRLQLSQRFGQLPGAIAVRVDRAGQADLERWSRRLIPAESLDDVFDEPTR